MTGLLSVHDYGNGLTEIFEGRNDARQVAWCHEAVDIGRGISC